MATDEIHTWCTSLDQPGSLVRKLFDTLSVDEEERAGRFYFLEDRNRFIVRHGILRTVLGYYLGVAAKELQFCYGANGKPRVADPFREGAISFSMSSSVGLAIFAFTRNHEIGIDVEFVRDLPEMDEIADRLFSTRESKVYRGLPETLKKNAFFACWTRKEAFVKATGDGLSRPLNKLEMTVDPGDPAKLVSIDTDAKSASRWSIYDLKPAFGFSGAIAAEAGCCRVRCWQWTNGHQPRLSTQGMRRM